MGFPQAVVDNALVACGRCCCICHRFRGLKIELHHIKPKRDGGDDTFENAIPLCFDCHGDMVYDPRHPKGRKYSATELRRHRDNWYATVLQQQGRPVPARDAANGMPLSVKVSIRSTSSVLQSIGCPCVVVALTCQVNEHPGIGKLRAWVQGGDFMSALNAGFGGRLGHIPPPPKYDTPQTCFVDMLPISDKARRAAVLRKYDVVKFAFPVAFPGIALFCRAESTVGIQMVIADDAELELENGDRLRKALTEAYAFYGRTSYSLHRQIKMTVRALSANLPKLSAVGTVNEFPIATDGRAVDGKSVESRVDLISWLFEALWNNWVRTERFQYSLKPDQSLEGKSLVELKAIPFSFRVGLVAASLTLHEVVALFRFVADQLHEMKESRGNQKDPNHQIHTSLLNLLPSDAVIAQTLPQLTFDDTQTGEKLRAQIVRAVDGPL